MKWYWWVLIGLGSLILVILVIKIATRKNSESKDSSSGDSNSLFDKVKDACCAVLGKK